MSNYLKEILDLAVKADGLDQLPNGLQEEIDKLSNVIYSEVLDLYSDCPVAFNISQALEQVERVLVDLKNMYLESDLAKYLKIEDILHFSDNADLLENLFRFFLKREISRCDDVVESLRDEKFYKIFEVLGVDLDANIVEKRNTLLSAYDKANEALSILETKNVKIAIETVYPDLSEGFYALVKYINFALQTERLRTSYIEWFVRSGFSLDELMDRASRITTGLNDFIEARVANKHTVTVLEVIEGGNQGVELSESEELELLYEMMLDSFLDEYSETWSKFVSSPEFDQNLDNILGAIKYQFLANLDKDEYSFLIEALVNRLIEMGDSLDWSSEARIKFMEKFRVEFLEYSELVEGLNYIDDVEGDFLGKITALDNRSLSFVEVKKLVSALGSEFNNNTKHSIATIELDEFNFLISISKGARSGRSIYVSSIIRDINSIHRYPEKGDLTVRDYERLVEAFGQLNVRLKRS